MLSATFTADLIGIIPLSGERLCEATRGMVPLQLLHGLRFYLAGSLTGDVKLAAGLFQRMRLQSEQTIPKHDYLSLSRCERLQSVLKLIMHQVTERPVRRRAFLIGLDEISKSRVTFRPHRRIQRDRLGCASEEEQQLLLRDAGGLGDLKSRRRAAQTLEQLFPNANNPADGVDHVRWKADGAALICKGP